jgi:ferritin-like metal-binding protein YciE
MNEEEIRELLLMKMRDLYDAERQITKALPKMIKKASNQDLADLLEEHLGQTEEQLERLDEAFAELEESPKGHACLAMAGLIDEGKEMLQLKLGDVATDVLIIDSAQAVEHYEIAGYATVLSYADMLGYDKVADLLEETLEEEEAADDKLYAVLEEILVMEESEEDYEEEV